MSKKEPFTLKRKWESKFNDVRASHTLQTRLKKRLGKDAAEQKRSGNKKGD